MYRGWVLGLHLSKFRWCLRPFLVTKTRDKKQVNHQIPYAPTWHANRHVNMTTWKPNTQNLSKFTMPFLQKMFFFVYLLSNGCYAWTWLPQKVPIHILQLNTNPLVPIMCLYLKNWQIYSYFQFSWFKQ